MTVTPDRFPGTREEFEIALDEQTGVEPAEVGGIVYSDGAFKLRDSSGVYDPRSGGGGITEAQHEILDTQIHALAETRETVVTRDAGKVTEILERTVDETPLSIRKTEITRSAGNVSQIVVRQYDTIGTEITEKRMTGTVNRSGGKVSTIDWVEGTS